MQDEKKPSTEDRERLERYLKWRERTEGADRRRRRVRRAVVIGALGVVAVGVLTLLLHASRDTRTPVALTPGGASLEDVAALPETPPESAATPEPTAPPAIEGEPAAERPAAPLRTTTRTAARTPRRAAGSDNARAVPQREAALPSALPPAVAEDRAESSDAVAAETTPGERRAAEHAADTVTSNTAPSSTPPVSAGDQSPAVIAPGNAAAAVARPACPDMAAMLDGGPSPDGRSRSKKVVECVGGWVKGEAQEFRDGIKRGIDEFRVGFERVGRGLQRLGSKLRP